MIIDWILVVKLGKFVALSSSSKVNSIFGCKLQEIFRNY